MKHLVTGGLGFIGSNYIRLMAEVDPHTEIVNLDLGTYAGNPDNLADLPTDFRYQWVRGDIGDAEFVDQLFAEHRFDAVVHFAAESHVDRSIRDPLVFVRTNVVGTQVLLDAARRYAVKRFVMVSTDEVYGSLGPEGAFTEETPLSPRSPYSASKAGADQLALAYFHTYDMDVVVTRCSNNYGPYQFPEKLIPLMILNARAGKELPVYGDGLYVRDWIHVLDHCRGVRAALDKGQSGRVYNFGARNEWPNIEIVRTILKHVGRPESLIRHVQDRPGHDRRYAIDPQRAEQELGWHPQISFDQGLRDTIAWYENHEEWLRRVTTGEYQQYYEDMYGHRLNQ